MICYIYDGTFEGLLTSIYEAYYRKEKPEEIYDDSEFVQTLITESIYIAADHVKADKVYKAIENKISKAALEKIFHSYLSELPGASSAIYRYIKLGFKLGADVDLHLHNSIVLNIHNISRKVTNEVHRMAGFVRFKYIHNELLYAPMEPDHNILGLITPHFAERLSSESFVIHDVRRELASMYNKREWIITPLKDSDSLLTNNNGDEVYENLWKSYFNTIAIENRTNPRLQKRSMPVRYWKHLTEFS